MSPSTDEVVSWFRGVWLQGDPYPLISNIIIASACLTQQLGRSMFIVYAILMVDQGKDAEKLLLWSHLKSFAIVTGRSR